MAGNANGRWIVCRDVPRVVHALIASAATVSALPDRAPVAVMAQESQRAEDFVREHWERLFRVAYLVSADHLAAEDIAQEAMLNAWRGRAAVDGRDPGPWLNRVAANAARDWLRKHAKRRETLVADAPEVDAEPDHEGLIDAVTTRSELTPGLERALHRLEPDFRVVVVLRHLLDLEPTEIAELLEIPAATVRSRDHRALKRLRSDLIGEEDPDAGRAG